MITLFPMEPFVPQETPLMEAAKAKAETFHKLGICLTADEGARIAFLMGLSGCERVVEIGTLTGYSTLWWHRALPLSGQIWTLEKDAEHAQAAREIFSQLSGGAAVELIEGDARENLKNLSSQAPFDAVFIDVNKGAYWEYLMWAEGCVRKGGLIVFDNVFLGGALDDPHYKGKFSKRVIRQMHEVVARLSDPVRYRTHWFGGRDGLVCAQLL